MTVLHFQRQFTQLSRQSQDQAGNVATHVEESALGLRVIKSFGREEHAYRGFDERVTGLYDTEVRKVAVSAKFWTLLEVIPNITLIIVLGVGAYATGHGHISMGTLVAFITMMLSLVWPIASLGFLLSMTQESMTAANRVAEIFDAPREITDGPHTAAAHGGRLELRRRRLPVPGLGHLGAATRQPDRGVRGDGRPGRVPPGRASRCWPRCCPGCTTSARAPSWSTAPTSASCRCPRCGARWPPPSRTRRCSPCRWPRTCASATPTPPTRSWPGASTSPSAEFVYDLPFGLDTRIGEQGMSLSGGQRQRLSLARAIIADPRILVLDDTLSALDVHTEAEVTEALGRVLRDVTGIVVAHRASTVLLADRVALLENGTVTRVGTHARTAGRGAGVPVPAGRRRGTGRGAVDERQARMSTHRLAGSGGLRRRREPAHRRVDLAAPRGPFAAGVAAEARTGRCVAVLAVVVVVENAARLSVPLLVQRGIDHGIPPIAAGGIAHELLLILAALCGVVVLQADQPDVLPAPVRAGSVRRC